MIFFWLFSAAVFFVLIALLLDPVNICAKKLEKCGKPIPKNILTATFIAEFPVSFMVFVGTEMVGLTATTGRLLVSTLGVGLLCAFMLSIYAKKLA